MLADAMLDICNEDECNDTYGRIRMYQALQLKQPDGVPNPSERTVYRVMEEIGLSHKSKRKPNGIIILSRLVDTFFSRISLTMQPPPKPHNTACVLPWEEGRHWQSRSSGCSSS